MCIRDRKESVLAGSVETLKNTTTPMSWCGSLNLSLIHICSRGSSSDSLQTAGRELCMPDDIRRMRDDECLLLMRREDPVIDRKYNLLKHPNVKRCV